MFATRDSPAKGLCTAWQMALPIATIMCELTDFQSASAFAYLPISLIISDPSLPLLCILAPFRIMLSYPEF